MITLIGVGHVFNIAPQVRGAVLARNPDIVCIELDELRFAALLQRESGPREVPTERHGPLSLRLLSRFQEQVAESYDVEVGQEMLAAADAARSLGVRIALIDMDARIAFKRFLRAMGIFERIKFFAMLFAAAIGLNVGVSTVEEELKKFDDDSTAYLEAFGKEFPAAKTVLIDERNRFMAGRIRRAAEDHERIVAVIGDGHIEGIRKELHGWDLEVVRLRQLRDGFTTKLSDGETTYTYTIGTT